MEQPQVVHLLPSLTSSVCSSFPCSPVPLLLTGILCSGLFPQIPPFLVVLSPFLEGEAACFPCRVLCTGTVSLRMGDTSISKKNHEKSWIRANPKPVFSGALCHGFKRDSCFSSPIFLLLPNLQALWDCCINGSGSIGMPSQRDLAVNSHPRGSPLSRGLKIWVIYLKMRVLIDLLMVCAG